ncbi:MAG: hypothetical protein QQN41_07775 [Nitrosopumilus sp.]
MRIFNKTNSKRSDEREFLNKLLEIFPDSIHLDTEYTLQECLSKKTLKIDMLLRKIEKSKFISNLKKNRCVEELKLLPNEIKVVRNIKEISVDFVIEFQNTVYFVEFNENQHRIDSNKRCNKIYDLNNKPINIPRYLQRLLRDIWRWQYLKNYTIVWLDWFAVNKTTDIDYLNRENTEYALENKFTISGLLSEN